MQRDAEQSRIILDILESVHRDGECSQRSRASEVGIALGLVNAYLKFCIQKGYLKAKKMPARSYQYMLTPKGFMEKSRLALSRLSHSLDFLRATRAEYASLFEEAQSRDWKNVVIVSALPLAEICTLCALERNIRVVGIVDRNASEGRMLGMPVHRSFEQIGEPFDGAILADIHTPADSIRWCMSQIGAEQLLMPAFLRPHAPRMEATQ
ncbi:MAG: winged helix-turn-helix transcriptional regulator [Alphaproteobacteria bacterium]|nr:winged helix-turn-helix transcriptional regulator [Alphaproteobacteria bacterium]